MYISKEKCKGDVMRSGKRILAMLLTGIMLTGAVPSSAFAVEEGGAEATQEAASEEF